MTSQQGNSEPASQVEHNIHIALLAVWLPQKGWLRASIFRRREPCSSASPFAGKIASKPRNSFNFDLACLLPAAQLSSEKAPTARECDLRSEREGDQKSCSKRGRHGKTAKVATLSCINRRQTNTARPESWFYTGLPSCIDRM
jgi:hypothetical protein